MPFPANKTKLVCTIGPASDSAAMLENIILAGMNVTDELFSAKHEKERLENQVEERIQALSELIDEALST